MVKAPAGKTVEWDSVVTDDEPGRLIAWQSVEGADVASSGRVEFLDAAPGRGTIVRATFAYDPPAGAIGEWIAKLFQREPEVADPPRPETAQATARNRRGDELGRPLRPRIRIPDRTSPVGE